MESNILEADMLVQSALDNLITGVEGSFDSGYSTSPVRIAAGLPSSSQLNPSSSEMLLGPVKSPFKVNTSSNTAPPLPFSPVKSGSSSMFSPFKESSLSPFKLLSQSPSKGTFDDWDKELFSSLDENLFGTGVISDNVLDELLKSPQGKAYLESRSPLRNMGNSGVVRQLRISPETNRHRGRHFHSLNDQSSDMFTLNVNQVKTEPVEYTETKEEDTLEDQIYGQQTSRSGNGLGVIDPNKMGETPVKPVPTNVENVPKRKLSMRAVGGLMVDHSLGFNVVRQDTLQSRPTNCSTWPSKERLKFARQQFKDVLEQAVAKHRMLLLQDRKSKVKPKSEGNVVVMPMVNARGGHVTHGGKGKAPRKKKTYRKKKNTVPTKGVTTKAARGSKPATVIQNNVFSVGKTSFDDPCWYPSDDDDDTWTGPLPFYTGSPLYEEEEDESTDDDITTFKYETISGRQVNLKRPKLR